MRPKQAMKVKLVFLTLILGLCARSGAQTEIQSEESPNIHVLVNMVQLNVAVTDKKGNYITGLRPQDFEVTEDNIPQKLAVFAEGHESIPVPTDPVQRASLTMVQPNSVQLAPQDSA